jgi:hypothetical protein
MAVFNAAANQVLAQPVSAFYQGKAIRQEQELRQKEIDSFDKKLSFEERRVAAQEAQNQRLTDEVNLRREEFENRVGQEASKEYAKQGYSIIHSLEPDIQAGGARQEDALARAHKEISEYARGLPAEDAGPLLDKLSDGILDLQEYRNIKAGFVMGMEQYDLLEDWSPTSAGYKAMANYRGPDGLNYIGWMDEFGVHHKTGILTDSQEGIKFSPVSAGERAAALGAIKNDPILSDLSSNGREVAAEIVANYVRQLQENQGNPYQEALAMALAGLKQRLILEPDLLTGRDTKIDLTPELAENEYLGRDGNIWVEEEDGSFRRKQ